MVKVHHELRTFDKLDLRLDPPSGPGTTRAERDAGRWATGAAKAVRDDRQERAPLPHSAVFHHPSFTGLACLNPA